MVRRVLRVHGPDEASVAALKARFARIRADLDVPAGFPPEVLAAAEQAARQTPATDGDLRAIPFVTVDPPGSTDLDQALHLAVRPPAGRDGGDGGARDGAEHGYVVHYAIADVPAFVQPGGPVAEEAHRRGQTLYAPDGRTPLHPPVLSEGAASLLPDVDRPAYVWRFELAPDGQVEAFDVVRALVRSRAKLAYAQVQAAADGAPPGTSAEAAAVADDPDGLAAQAALLRRVGALRAGLERARGGVNLDLPEQEVIADRGGFRLQLRAGLPAEDWNAQLSLMTGMAAARLMLDAGIGILRTLPPADGTVLDRFRRQAAALGLSWGDGEPLGSLLDRLDRTRPAHLALLHEAGSLFRGAAYTPLPAQPASASTVHAAVAAHYAHVTAPLRRLVDRFGLVVAHAICRGDAVPSWAVDALPSLPAVMAASDQRAGALDRACRDAVEAAVLAARIGETFDAVVVDVTQPKNGGPPRAKVQLLDPAVLASCDGSMELGTRARVRLSEVDPAAGSVRFTVA